MRKYFLTLACVLACAAGCDGRSALEFGPHDAGSDAPSDDAEAGPPVVEHSEKLDLLLAVDNSQNLAVAHELLAQTVLYLVDRLAHPACVNGLGNVVATTPSPTDPCPVGERDFAPITDLHVGVISTSLGGHGADLCSPASVSYKPPQDDAAHLLSRAAGGGSVPTYQDEGFLAWDPGQVLAPPGESDLSALGAKLGQVVRGTSTDGCGFEAQLESIYRFLVDPNPYASIAVQGNKAVPTGTDTVLLQQRADFVRPDSAVVVVLLTDEDDCSTRESGQYYLSNQGSLQGGGPYHLPRARSECATNPADPCCASCGQNTPPGCKPTASDPSCQTPYDNLGDPINLRCFDQKRRFGVDFLYPVERYIGALTKPTVTDRDGATQPNPLFASGRSPKLVFLEGIVGVPWQDIATDPKSLGTGYLPAGAIDWSLILGDPASGTPPSDPLMIQSIDPRTGANPATGAALAPPSSPIALANPINGHERDLPERDDLQYACIYPRPATQDCSAVATDCECIEGQIDTNPICQDPSGAYTSVERYVRAVPGRRELQVLQGLGDQAVVASVCAEQVKDPSQATFAYKPAVDALLRTVRARLGTK